MVQSTRRGTARRTNASAVASVRGPLRRLLDVWGFVPGFDGDASHHDIVTRDRVRLRATYLPAQGPPRPLADVPALVLLHGFAGHRRKPTYAFLAERLAAGAAVLTVDLRGHGHSSGASTLGLAETMDATAAATWLRRRGHRWVALVGASMGGTTALRTVALAPPGAYDAVAVISAPALWGLNDTPTMQSMTRAVLVPWRRRVLSAGLRVRIAGRAWPGPRVGTMRPDDPDRPLQPLDAVGRVAPTPLLIVHGADDHFYDAEQALLLYAAAREPKALWIEPVGFGHAEDGFGAAFADRLAAAVVTVHATGAWPVAAAP